MQTQLTGRWSWVVQMLHDWRKMVKNVVRHSVTRHVHCWKSSLLVNNLLVIYKQVTILKVNKAKQIQWDIGTFLITITPENASNNIIWHFAATVVTCTVLTQWIRVFALTSFSTCDILGFETLQKYQLPINFFFILTEYVSAGLLSISAKNVFYTFGHIQGFVWTVMICYIVFFLADHTIGHAFGTLCRLSVCRLSVSDVLYCGETVRPS